MFLPTHQRDTRVIILASGRRGCGPLGVRVSCVSLMGMNASRNTANVKIARQGGVKDALNEKQKQEKTKRKEKKKTAMEASDLEAYVAGVGCTVKRIFPSIYGNRYRRCIVGLRKEPTA